MTLQITEMHSEIIQALDSDLTVQQAYYTPILGPRFIYNSSN